VTSSWFFLSTLNYDAQSTTHQIYLHHVCPSILPSVCTEQRDSQQNFLWNSIYEVCTEISSHITLPTFDKNNTVREDLCTFIVSISPLLIFATNIDSLIYNVRAAVEVTANPKHKNRTWSIVNLPIHEILNRLGIYGENCTRNYLSALKLFAVLHSRYNNGETAPGFFSCAGIFCLVVTTYFSICQ
jgi:hypothetical protein